MNDSLVVGIFFLGHPEKIIFYLYLLKKKPYFFVIFNIFEIILFLHTVAVLKSTILQDFP